MVFYMAAVLDALLRYCAQPCSIAHVLTSSSHAPDSTSATKMPVGQIRMGTPRVTAAHPSVAASNLIASQLCR